MFSWESSLKQLVYDADVVFFGDSITRGGNFQRYFPDLKIVNLGCTGDTLEGMRGRLSMIKTLSPQKVFLMGGINGLTDHNIEKCIAKYEQLLTDIREVLPDTQIYVQSLLPISTEKQRQLLCHDRAIRCFNESIRKLSEKHEVKYVDLYPLYEQNGQIEPTLTVDGMHIKPEAYERWAEMIHCYVCIEKVN